MMQSLKGPLPLCRRTWQIVWSSAMGTTTRRDHRTNAVNRNIGSHSNPWVDGGKAWQMSSPRMRQNAAPLSRNPPPCQLKLCAFEGRWCFLAAILIGLHTNAWGIADVLGPQGCHQSWR